MLEHPDAIKINTQNQYVCPKSIKINALNAGMQGLAETASSVTEPLSTKYHHLSGCETKKSRFQAQLGNQGGILVELLYPLLPEEAVKFTTGSEQAKEECFGKSYRRFQAGRAALPAADSCTTTLPFQEVSVFALPTIVWDACLKSHWKTGL